MQDYILQFFSLGAIGLLIFCIASITLSFSGSRIPSKLYSKIQGELIFFISLFGSMGSILLSVYFGLAPCELCWYQRTMLFSIPIISGIALYRHDTGARVYAFALSIVGVIIAIYHTILQTGLLGLNAAFCNPGSPVDCAVPTFVHFGFVTVPLISLAVFLLIAVIAYPYEDAR